MPTESVGADVPLSGTHVGGGAHLEQTLSNDRYEPSTIETSTLSTSDPIEAGITTEGERLRHSGY